ncbi:SlyX family protein [Utexia brackfieldae]|uniref:SlyX family protein n=1 Tax=Utexia brackfieldae TaxID=3074108 RepID=UPI00370D19A4
MTEHLFSLNQRIEILETKVAFQEMTIEELNQMIILLQKESLQYAEQMRLLTEKLQSAQISYIASQSEETPPPHY